MTAEVRKIVVDLSLVLFSRRKETIPKFRSRILMSLNFSTNKKPTSGETNSISADKP
jgi:hypothetical protein